MCALLADWLVGYALTLPASSLCLSLLPQATTTPNCGLGYDYERLELLGDSFLKVCCDSLDQISVRFNAELALFTVEIWLFLC